jgi:hypothetical protein
MMSAEKLQETFAAQTQTVLDAQKKVVDFQMAQAEKATKAVAQQMSASVDMGMNAVKAGVDMALDMQKAALSAMTPKAQG